MYLIICELEGRWMGVLNLNFKILHRLKIGEK